MVRRTVEMQRLFVDGSVAALLMDPREDRSVVGTPCLPVGPVLTALEAQRKAMGLSYPDWRDAIVTAQAEIRARLECGEEIVATSALSEPGRRAVNTVVSTLVLDGAVVWSCASCDRLWPYRRVTRILYAHTNGFDYYCPNRHYLWRHTAWVS